MSSIILWQILPDEYWGPYKAINPHAITEFVVTILFVSALGKLSAHLLGNRFGLPLAGLIGGFASSTATIYTMGQASKKTQSNQNGVVLGAILSCVSTLLQIAFLCQLLAPQLVLLVIKPIALGILTITIFALVTLSKSGNIESTVNGSNQQEDPFDLKSIITLTTLVIGVSFLSGLLFSLFGDSAVSLVAAISGLADAHAVIPSLAALINQEKLLPHQALTPIMIAFSVNTCTKCLIAFQVGGKQFGYQVSSGLVLTSIGTWLGSLVS